MSNQTVLIAAIVLCSLAGWYIVIKKYLALKSLLTEKTASSQQNHSDPAITRNKAPEPIFMPDPFEVGIEDYVPGEHIPGMGPPPTGNMGYRVPAEVIAAIQQGQQQGHNKDKPSTVKAPNKPNVMTHSKRELCNWASIMHLSGIAFITGVPFLNIILPAVLWLLKKEQHPFLAKQGREVINFQITLTLIQFLCLALGTVFIWTCPNAASNLLQFTKSMRIVFATGMNLAFNIFTALPFFWGCIMVMRGTIAAYHGINYRYQYAQSFIPEPRPSQREMQTEQVVVRKEPQLQPEFKTPNINRINFG